MNLREIAAIAIDQALAPREATVEDADTSSRTVDLQRHDAMYHPQGYKEGDTCKYRERLAAGDDVDALDPENVEGESAPEKASGPSAESNAQAQVQALKKAEQDVKDVLADIEEQVDEGHYTGGGVASGNVPSGYTGPGYGLMELSNCLKDYEKAYDDAMGATPATKVLSALAKKCGNGAMGAILKLKLASAKAQVAATALPQGTKTPQEMRNEATLAIARMLGASLESPKPAASATPAPAVPPPAKQRRNPDMPEEVEDAVLAAKINPSWYTKQGTPTPQGATVFRSGDMAADENTAKDLAETMAKAMPNGWTVGVHGNGRMWEVDIADKDVFSTDNAYSSVYEGGTGNLIPPKPSISAQFGPRPSLTNDESDFPDDSDFDFGNYGKTSSGYHSAGSGSTNPHWIDINGQRYYVKQAGNNPTYNNDAAQNEVNANKFLRMAGLLAPESKLYTENGVNYCVTKALPHSGNLATGNLSDPSVKKQLEEAYPVMDLMYNTDILQNDNAYIDKNGDIAFIDNGSSFGTSAQGTRNSKKKFGFDYDARSDPYSGNPDEDYGALSRHSSQAAWNQIAAGTDINEQAAKWKLGWLAKEAIKQGLVPKQAQSAFQQFADAIDNYSDKKFPNLRPGKAPAVSSATASSPASANTAPSTTPQSSSSQGGTASTSQSQSASATPQPQQPSGNSPAIMPNGVALFNAMPKISQTWTPNLGTRQSRNATNFLNAVASLPQSAVAGYFGTLQNQANKAIVAMLYGTFTANKSGAGGVVTGANIPRKGVQALSKYLNQIMNPQGYRIQIHNNGNVTISQSNRGIANAAMQAAGISPAPSSAPAATPSASAPSTTSSASTASASVGTPAQGAFSQIAWNAGIPAAPGAKKVNGNLSVHPNVPSSLTNGFSYLSGPVLSPSLQYTLTPGQGGYVLGLAPGQSGSTGNANAHNIMNNSPSIVGYTKRIGTNGIVYVPQGNPSGSAASSAGASPQPAASAPSSMSSASTASASVGTPAQGAFSMTAWKAGIPSAPGATQVRNLSVHPNVPSSLLNGFTSQNKAILGPTFKYTLTPGQGGYVLGLAPGQSSGITGSSATTGSRVMAFSPNISGYTKQLGTNGVVYVPQGNPSGSATPSTGNFSRALWAAGIHAPHNSTAHNNLKIAPGVPPSLVKGFTSLKTPVLGPGYQYTLTPSTGGYVLGLAPNQVTAKSTQANGISLLQSTPVISGYTKQLVPNGVLYVPQGNPSGSAASSAGVSPQPAASSIQSPGSASTPPATASSGAKSGNWNSLLNGMRQSSTSKSVRNAYNTVANWLNTAQQNGQI